MLSVANNLPVVLYDCTSAIHMPRLEMQALTTRPTEAIILAWSILTLIIIRLSDHCRKLSPYLTMLHLKACHPYGLVPRPMHMLDICNQQLVWPDSLSQILY